jgi:hypothetical protein
MASPGEYLDRIGALRDAGDTDAADFLAERYRTLKASGAFEPPGPAPRMQVEPVSFAPPGQVEGQIGGGTVSRRGPRSRSTGRTANGYRRPSVLPSVSD